MKTILLFPGFTSQFVGMGKELYDEYRVVQELFEEASNCLDKNFVKLCFASSEAELSKLPNAYPSIFLVSAAIVNILREKDITIDAVAGYDQGEYAALFAARGISLPDGLYLLSKYASLYERSLEAMDVKMIRVQGLTAQEAEDACLKSGAWSEGKAFIAIYESEKSHIIGGSTSTIERLREIIVDQYKDVVIDGIPNGIGLHSPVMKELFNEYKVYFEKVDIKDTQIPFIEAFHGKHLQKDSAIREHMIMAIDNPVVWVRVLNQLKEYDRIIQVGPGNKLISEVKQLYPEKEAYALNKKADFERLENKKEISE